uniref:Uncharacterized protein n=1 Tax=Anguilla anguilla TaxID=7936 RepID=A0A0E9T976_ANGAN
MRERDFSCPTWSGANLLYIPETKRLRWLRRRTKSG